MTRGPQSNKKSDKHATGGDFTVISLCSHDFFSQFAKGLSVASCNEKVSLTRIEVLITILLYRTFLHHVMKLYISTMYIYQSKNRWREKQFYDLYTCFNVYTPLLLEYTWKFTKFSPPPLKKIWIRASYNTYITALNHIESAVNCNWHRAIIN